MGGYRRKARLFNLAFAPDHPLHGLEVTARSVSMRDLLAVMELASLAGASLRDQAVGVGRLTEKLAELIVSWNLEDEDGNPVPATAEGVQGQDMDFVLALCESWIDAVAGVPAPLPQPSEDGAPSLEASIPMAVG